MVQVSIFGNEQRAPAFARVCGCEFKAAASPKCGILPAATWRNGPFSHKAALFWSMVDH